MAHQYSAVAEFDASHHLRKAPHTPFANWRTCIAGCGSAFCVDTGLGWLIAKKTRAPDLCPVAAAVAISANVGCAAKMAVDVPESAVPAGAAITKDQVVQALASLRFPTETALDLERAQPARALGDPELLPPGAEKPREDRYTVTGGWEGCVSHTLRKTLVLSAALWSSAVLNAEGTVAVEASPPKARRGSSSTTDPQTPAPSGRGSGAGSAAGGAAGAEAAGASATGPGGGLVDLSVRLSGRPVSVSRNVPVPSSSVSQLVLVESVLMDTLFQCGVALWLVHVNLNGGKHRFDNTFFNRAGASGAADDFTLVPWFWCWSETRARVATMRFLDVSRLFRLYGVAELAGSLVFSQKPGEEFDMALWLARLGLAHAVRGEPASCAWLSAMWASVNAAYVAAEVEVHHTSKRSGAPRSASMPRGFNPIAPPPAKRQRSVVSQGSASAPFQHQKPPPTAARSARNKRRSQMRLSTRGSSGAGRSGGGGSGRGGAGGGSGGPPHASSPS